MKLLLVESYDLDVPVWYFTTHKHAADYFGVKQSSLIHMLEKKDTYKKHHFEWVNVETTTRFINPDERGITINDYIKK